MKNKFKQIKEIFLGVGTFFVLLSLQTWYILTGNE